MITATLPLIPPVWVGRPCVWCGSHTTNTTVFRADDLPPVILPLCNDCLMHLGGLDRAASATDAPGR